MNEQRRIDRQNTAAPIEYEIDGRACPAHMTDMSRSGCRAVLAGPVPDVGGQLRIRLLEGVELPGRIAWRDGVVAGIAFDRPLIEAVVRYFRLPVYLGFKKDVTTDSFGRTLPPLGENGRPR